MYWVTQENSIENSVQDSLPYIQTDSIGDARGFSGKTPITLSGGFSVETLTGVTLSWKTELNRSISAMKAGISGVLQHRHGRWACMVQRWFYHGDVISGQVDLHMTIR